MKKNFLYALKLLKNSFYSLFLMEIIYRLLANFIVFPFCKFLFKLSLKISKVDYLATSNFLQLLKNPFADIILLFTLLILTIFIIFEMSSIIIILNQANKHSELSMKQLFNEALKRTINVLYSSNWSLIFLVMFLVPFADTAKLSTIISEIKIPWFIAKGTINVFPWNYIFGLLIILLTLYIFPRLLTPFYFIINGNSASSSSEKSLKLLKKRRERGLGSFILFYSLIIFVSALLSISIDELSGLIIEKLLSGTAENYILVSIHNTNKYIVNFIIDGMGVFANYSYLMAVKVNSEDLNDKIFNKEIIKSKDKLAHKHNKILFFVLVIIIFIISMVVNFFIAYAINVNKDTYNYFVSNTIKVIAHRGDDTNAPENTIPAFEKAIDEGADYVELDVQETKDGIIVVTHDSNFKRCTGYNGNVWNMNYDEIEKLDAGSKFSSEFKGTKIPTLDEVIKFAKGKTKLLIELKTNGHEVDLAKRTLDVINANDAIDDVMIHSLSYDELKKVKSLNPNVKCGYIMTFVTGSYDKLDAADFFSIETTSITSDNVSNIHKLGKEVYAWTIDEDDDMEKVINAGVDGVITNKVTSVKDKLKETDNLFIDTYKSFLSKLHQKIINLCYNSLLKRKYYGI